MTQSTNIPIPIDTESHHYNEFVRIVSIALGAWFIYVLSDTMTKWLAQKYPAAEILLIVYTLGLIVVVPYICLRHGPNALISKKWKWHIGRASSGAICSLLGVRALARIPLADYYGIIFLTPLLLCLMSHFILKERIGKHRVTAIIAGFVGVIVLAGPQFESGNIGFLYAIGAVVFSALNGILVRKIGQEKILLLFAFYLSIGNVVFSLLIWVSGASAPFIMPHLSDIPVFLIVPPVLLSGLLGWSYAFSHAKETAMIAPFNYSQMLWGVMIGYLLFHEVPSSRTLAGAAIIITAGLYMIWREHALHKASVLRSLQR